MEKPKKVIRGKIDKIVEDIKEQEKNLPQKQITKKRKLEQPSMFGNPHKSSYYPSALNEYALELVRAHIEPDLIMDEELPLGNSKPFVESTGNNNLIILMINAHGCIPSIRTRNNMMDVTTDCMLLKATASPEGVAYFSLIQNEGEVFAKWLYKTIEPYKSVLTNDPRKNISVFLNIRDEFIQHYSIIYSTIYRQDDYENDCKTDSEYINSNLSCVKDASNLFRLKIAGKDRDDKISNKYYSKKEIETRIKVIYDSRKPDYEPRSLPNSIFSFPEIDTHADPQTDFPFAVEHIQEHKEEENKVREYYSLNDIYRYFKSLGFKAVYIFDFACETYSGGNKKTYRIKKNKNIKRKNKNIKRSKTIRNR